MMQICHCNQCGNDLIELDAVSVNVELSKSHHCDKCYHSHEEKTTYFFCSLECFVAYCKQGGEFKFEK